MSTRDAYLSFQRDRSYVPPRTRIGQPSVDAPKSKVGIVIIVLVIILIVTAVVVAIILFLRSRSSATTGVTDNGNTNGGENGNGGTTGCANNSDCPSETPLCDTATNTCKECLGDSDCISPATCDGGNCCDASDPVIDTVTPTTSSDSSVVIDYTYSQVGYTDVMVTAVVETPGGVELASATEAATGSITLQESTLGIPHDHLFPNTSYQVKIKITYSCGTGTGLETNFTVPEVFTMPSCADVTASTDTSAGNAAGNSNFDSYNGMIIRFFTLPAPVDMGVLISPTPGFHPNEATIYYPSITISETTIILRPTPIDPGGPFTLRYLKIPYPGPVGSTHYIRYFQLGSTSQCDSNLSAQLSWTRTY